MNAPAVALVPGFLGFDHKGGTTYFADRFVAGIRGALEALGMPGVPVIPTSTLPVSSLAERQASLLADLARLERGDPKHPELTPLGERSWHLIGHSTGGLDVALLLRAHPLSKRGDDVSAYDASVTWPNVIGRVRSVTSISAPHFGTALAESRVARMTEGGESTSDRVMALGKVLALGADALGIHDDIKARIQFAGASAAPFIPLLVHNDLARELRPAVAGALSQAPIVGERAMFSVVTVAPKPGPKPEDKLFADLWGLTAEGVVRAGPAPALASSVHVEALRLASQVRNRVAVPALDDMANDGVVTSRRQFLGTPIAIVVGDHADVLGRYRRTAWSDGGVIDPGLLTSGANFDDDAFFDLIQVIARAIARSAQPAS